MIGRLVEYHNPSPGERYGILKEKQDNGKYKVITGWYGLSGGLGHSRTSSPTTYEELDPEKVWKRRDSIQKHFERIWATSNARAAATKTVCFSNNSKEQEMSGEIKYLPKAMAEVLEDFFLSEGWFAYVE